MRSVNLVAKGHLLDRLRYLGRRPPDRAVASWPEDMRVLDTDAGRIRVRDTGGHGPALVVVPDGPCVIEHFEALIAELKPHFRTVCFEMPGVGFSYPSLSYDFGLEKSAEIVVAVLDELEIEKAILSFSCVNGYIAMATAKSFPARISGLVLVQTPSLDQMNGRWTARNIPRPLQILGLGQLVSMVLERRLASAWFDMALPKDNQHKEEFRRRSLSALRTGACFCLASIVQGMGTFQDEMLSGVETPTTMIWGNKDWSHKDTDFRSIEEHLPNCEVVLFDGCGHFPCLERPRAFAARLRDSASG